MRQSAALMGYYIANDGVQQGPFELNELPQQGLRADSMVWREGMAQWVRADAVPEVNALLNLNNPPAISPSTISVATPSALAYQSPPPPGQTNGMAIASMVLGIVCIPLFLMDCIGIIPAILAIIFGFIARKKIKRQETAVGGGMALAGIILGFVYLSLMAIIIGCFLIFVAVQKAHHRAVFP